MAAYREPWRLTAAGLALLCGIAAAAPGQAQNITLDGTMGPSGTLDGPDYEITADLGTQLGGNLFHSFGAFNVLAGESAVFSGPNTVANVIGRVTGGATSTIDGRLASTIPDADLYLINPSGVVFGAGASLDVQGSFHVSTADAIDFADGGRFDATSPGDSVLSVAPPSAFGFLAPEPAPITVSGSILEVPGGASLSLVGGDMEIADAALRATGGQVNIVGAASAGQIELGSDGFAADNMSDLGTIDLSGSTINVSGFGGQRVVIRGGRFTVVDSQFLATNLGDGAGGSITIDVDSLTARDASISANTVGAGRGGDVTVTAREAITLTNSEFVSDSGILSTGDAGTVFVSASDLTMHKSFLYSETFGGGASGTVVVDVEHLELTDGEISADSEAFSRFREPAVGDAGEVSVTVADLILTDGEITADSKASGRGGTVTVVASGSIRLERASIDADATPNRCMEGCRGGPAGNVSVVADTLVATDSSIQSNGEDFGGGGEVFVQARRLILSNGAIASDAFESGDAGNVAVLVADEIVLDNAVIGSVAPAGAAGDVVVSATNSIRLADSSIVTEALEAGGGDITVSAARLVDLARSEIATSVSGGNITVDPVFLILDNSFIGSTAAPGDAGTVTIIAGHLIIDPESTIEPPPRTGTSATFATTTAEADPSADITASRESPLAAAAMLKRRCTVRGGWVTARATGLDPGRPLPQRHANAGIVPAKLVLRCAP